MMEIRSNFSRRRLLVAGGLLLTGLTLHAWLSPAKTATANYRSEPAARGDIRVTVTATGNVQPTNQVDVGSEISGTVAAVLVDDNDHVKRGQVLARLDTDRLENQVSRAAAQLRSAEAGVQQARATVRETRAGRDRLLAVFEKSNGTLPSPTDMEAAEATFARASANESAAHAAVSEAQAALFSARTDLSRASIRSPINGVVLARKVEPGQTVAASLQAPVLFTLAEDLARMELKVDVDEAEVGKVRTGQEASFTVDAWPDREYPAKIIRVRFGAETVDGVVSYEATLAVDNRDLSLRPGMTATATIAALHRRDVLRVPNAALRWSPPEATSAAAESGGILAKLLPRPPQQNPKKAGTSRRSAQQQVWTLADGTPHAVPVTTGETDGRFTEITGGELRDDDAVIVESVRTNP